MQRNIWSFVLLPSAFQSATLAAVQSRSAASIESDIDEVVQAYHTAVPKSLILILSGSAIVRFNSSKLSSSSSSVASVGRVPESSLSLPPAKRDSLGRLLGRPGPLRRLRGLFFS